MTLVNLLKKKSQFESLVKRSRFIVSTMPGRGIYNYSAEILKLNLSEYLKLKKYSLAVKNHKTQKKMHTMSKSPQNLQMKESDSIHRISDIEIIRQ